MKTRELDERIGPCPKRPWVMTVLSDDEAIAESGGVPAALNLHLASCAGCRELADRLMKVGDLLGAMAAMTPAPALISGADAQLAQALQHGAVLSGRVEVQDDSALRLPAVPVRRSNHVVRWAVAAVVVMGIGGAALFQLFTVDSGYRPGSDPGRTVVYPHEDSGADADLAESPPPYLVRSLSDPVPQDRFGSIAHQVVGKPCFHNSLLEAAECERVHGMHPAMGMRFRGDRPGSGDPPLDKSRNAVSTPQRADRP